MPLNVRDIKPWRPRPPAESETHGLENTAVEGTEEAPICPAVLCAKRGRRGRGRRLGCVIVLCSWSLAGGEGEEVS